MHLHFFASDIENVGVAAFDGNLGFRAHLNFRGLAIVALAGFEGIFGEIKHVVGFDGVVDGGFFAPVCSISAVFQWRAAREEVAKNSMKIRNLSFLMGPPLRSIMPFHGVKSGALPATPESHASRSSAAMRS
jgi:hypothetical protein